MGSSGPILWLKKHSGSNNWNFWRADLVLTDSVNLLYHGGTIPEENHFWFPTFCLSNNTALTKVRYKVTECIYIYIKVKVKFILKQAIKAQREIDVELYTFFNVGARWGGWLPPRPCHFNLGKSLYPLYRRLGGPQGRSGKMRKISPPTGMRSPDRPARNELLYRLIYPGSQSRNMAPLIRNLGVIVGWVVKIEFLRFAAVTQPRCPLTFRRLMSTTVDVPHR